MEPHAHIVEHLKNGGTVTFNIIRDPENVKHKLPDGLTMLVCDGVVTYYRKRGSKTSVFEGTYMILFQPNHPDLDHTQ